MSNAFTGFIIFVVMSVSIYGCATSPQTIQKELGGEIVHDTFSIEPSRSHEECVYLQPGMMFDYDFESSDFVNFNIHYHAMDGIHYPVDKSGITGDEGHIDPATHEYYDEDQDAYCLMWDNLNDEAVTISFTCILKNN